MADHTLFTLLNAKVNTDCFYINDLCNNICIFLTGRHRGHSKLQWTLDRVVWVRVIALYSWARQSL